jgi:hypothetical protein
MAPALCLAVLGCLLLYPFRFSPRNGVHRLGPDAGIYFDGGGIAYTNLGLAELAGTPLDELTVELWLHERKTSKNWGPRIIFSITDELSGPALFFGQWGGRLLLFSPDGEWTEPWYWQFILEPIMKRGEDHFAAVTIERERRAIFMDDLVAENLRVAEPGAPELDLSGRLILGASAGGLARWWGEIRGLALYRRGLTPEEIEAHRSQAREAGVKSLVTEEDLIALFAFEEAAGELAHNLADTASGIRIPARFGALPETLFHLPDLERFWSRGSVGDVFRNVLLFGPLGWLLAAFTSRRIEGRRVWVACGVILAGGCLSLTFEAIQLLIPERAAGPLDVAANTLGTAIGALAFSARNYRNRARTPSRGRVGGALE